MYKIACTLLFFALMLFVQCSSKNLKELKEDAINDCGNVKCREFCELEKMNCFTGEKFNIERYLEVVHPDIVIADNKEKTEQRIIIVRKCGLEANNQTSHCEVGSYLMKCLQTHFD